MFGKHLWVPILLLVVGCGAGCRPSPAPIPAATETQVFSPTSPVAPTSPAGDDTATSIPTMPSPEPTLTDTPGASKATLVEGEAMTPAPTPSEESTGEEPLLRMITIRAKSSREVQQLRGMPLVNVVAVRPDPDRPPGDDNLSGGFIVEAVVPRDILARLEVMGFEISEAPAGN